MIGKLPSRDCGVEIEWEATRTGVVRKLTVHVIPVWWNAIYGEDKTTVFVGIGLTLKGAIEQIEENVKAEIVRWEFMSAKMRDVIERPSTMQRDYPYMHLIHHGESRCVAINSPTTTITRPHKLLYK